MARKPRVEYAGAFYHVIRRRNQRLGEFVNRSVILATCRKASPRTVSRDLIVFFLCA